MSRDLVIYHASCPDGFAAAWAAWTALGDQADYLACHYSQTAPDVEQYQNIYIVDFSFSREILENWHANGKKLVLLDHHKTAIERLADLAYCHLDINHSGAVLSWQYFHPDQPVPELLLYVEDRDLWRWQLPKSKEIAAAMRSYKFDFPLFSQRIAQGIDDTLISEGSAILRFQQQIVESQAGRPVWRTIGGYRVPTVNTATFLSEVTEVLCENHPNSAFSAAWFEREDGKRQWRLTSRGSFDVSAIARLYGGGGHFAASGFETDGDIFEG